MGNNRNDEDASRLAREDLIHRLDEQRSARKPTARVVSLPTADLPTPPRVYFGGRLAEPDPSPLIVPNRRLTGQSRRDFVIYAGGVALVAAGFFWALPDDTRQRLGVRPPANPDPAKEKFLSRVLSFDDDVAEALYSPSRLVPTYDITQSARELRNNYDGQTPDPDSYLADWILTIKGLASGRTEHLTADALTRLTSQFGRRDQVTRLVCVEGWSMIAAWGGLRFADLLQAYPPAPGTRWASLESSVNLDSDGNSDPYYVSIDLPTAKHPQTLLATHQNDAQLQMVPLTAEHGAPLRLLAPMKLGLKNIKAVTGITYMATEPPDYWNERGYSKYDGL